MQQPSDTPSDETEALTSAVTPKDKAIMQIETMCNKTT